MSDYRELDEAFGEPPENVHDKLDAVENRLRWIDEKLEKIISTLGAMSFALAILVLYEFGVFGKLVAMF